MSRLPDLRYEDMTAEQQRVHDEIAAGPRGTVKKGGGPIRSPRARRSRLRRRWSNSVAGPEVGAPPARPPGSTFIEN